MNQNFIRNCIGSIYPIINFFFVFFGIGLVFMNCAIWFGMIYWLVIYLIFILIDIKMTKLFFKQKYQQNEYIYSFMSFIILTIFFCYIWEDTKYCWEDILVVFIAHSIFYCYKVFMMLKTGKQ